MTARELIRRFAALPAVDRRLALEGTVLAVGVEAALRLLPLGRVVRWCQRDRAVNRPWARAALDGMVPAAHRCFRILPWRSTCLRRSLVLTALLRRRGRPATMRFGVRRDDAGTLQAHAWVECDGRPVEAASSEGFEMLTAPIDAAAGLTRAVRWSP